MKLLIVYDVPYMYWRLRLGDTYLGHVYTREELREVVAKLQQRYLLPDDQIVGMPP